MKSMAGKETIFAYKHISATIPKSHRALVEEVLGGYRAWISDSQRKLVDLEASNRAEVNAIRSEIPRLTKEAERVASELAAQEAQTRREQKERGGGYSLALGCSGCLTILGLLVFGGILIEFFGINKSTGVTDTIGKLILYSPLVLLMPILITGRSIAFYAKRRALRAATHDKQLEIESKIRAVEPAANEAEKRTASMYKPHESEFNRLRVIYQETVAVLEERLSIANSN